MRAMKVDRADREVFAVGSVVFSFVALVLAFGAIVTAAHSNSQTSTTAKRVDKLASAGVIGSTAAVAPAGVLDRGTSWLGAIREGDVEGFQRRLDYTRVGHGQSREYVGVASGEHGGRTFRWRGRRGGDRRGRQDGRNGRRPRGTTVTKTFDLTTGTYVMFCNMDDKDGGALLNHFTHGMVASLVVV